MLNLHHYLLLQRKFSILPPRTHAFRLLRFATPLEISPPSSMELRSSRSSVKFRVKSSAGFSAALPKMPLVYLSLHAPSPNLSVAPCSALLTVLRHVSQLAPAAQPTARGSNVRTACFPICALQASAALLDRSAPAHFTTSAWVTAARQGRRRGTAAHPRRLPALEGHLCVPH